MRRPLFPRALSAGLALALLAGFFVVGAAIVAFVNERAGVLSARQAEREYRAGLPVRGGSGVLPPTMGA